MLAPLLALMLAAPQQVRPIPGPSLAPSPIDRIIVEPADRRIEAGGTLQLRARAVDSAGQPLEAVYMFNLSSGARFEGTVEPTGLVRSAATGTLPVTVSALVPGTAPVHTVVEVEMVPGPVARVDIDPAPGRLVVGQRARLSARSFSVHGDPRQDPITWSSSATGVAQVTEDGLLTAVAPGQAEITARAGPVTAAIAVQVLPDAVAAIEVSPSRIQARQGDVVRFTVTARDGRGRVIEDITPTWTFSPGHGVVTADGAFVGYEAGEYLVTANLGNRSADAVVTLSHRDVRRPLTVVGRLPRTLFTTEEVWVHPDGEVAYLGTGRGGDRLYVIDISNPANPVVTDSIVSNTRRVNDVMTTPDGRYLVHTREGAADRRNGIVIASLEDPRHPRVIAHFTDGVTSGVHSAFVYHQPEYGTHVYATNNGNNSLDIIDINDPYNPVRAGRFKINDWDAGNYLHDVDVQDGLAYLSYWNEGLVILDVGNGLRGGSPMNPVMISQFKYDLDELYRDVIAEGGPGYVRGTHTAWRHRNYVFIADEVFPAAGPRGAPEPASDRAYGRLQVIDVSDIENPRSVAWYEPEQGGVHNVWVANDTLYMGAYNAGFRVFDVSGELLGDLRAQGREIGNLITADDVGHTTGRPMTWGVVVKDGLAYVNDINNGLWIVRVEPETRRPLIP